MKGDALEFDFATAEPSRQPAGRGRKLSDRLLSAFHQACDEAELDVAEQVLRALELSLTRRPMMPPSNRRRMMECLVAAHERLWHLRHPRADQS